MTSGQLTAICVAEPELLDLGVRRRRTAIRKRIADGPTVIGVLGLTGDRAASKKDHGGPDQALYAYLDDDRSWWEATLGHAVPAGRFGENLAIAGIGSSSARCVGDRLAIGAEAVVEVTAPRIPCGTFSDWMGDATFSRRFAAARRPGLYLRVIVGGTVAAGDPVRLVAAGADALPVLELLDLFYDRRAPADRLERALRGPIAERARSDLEQRLGRLRS